jgi:hypothetical protein
MTVRIITDSNGRKHITNEPLLHQPAPVMTDEKGRPVSFWGGKSVEPIAQPAPVQPVWIQPDHLQKAQKAPFLCRVEPHKRDDFVPLYTTPPAAQRQWVGLTDAEVMQTMSGDWTSQFYFARAIEAKLKEKNDAAQPPVPDALNPKDENPAYAAGWNDCRAEMLKGMKP